MKKMTQELLLKNYENLDLRKLAKRIEKEGWVYTLHWRGKSKFIYAVLESKTGKIVRWDVFKNQIQWVPDNAHYKEVYPQPSQFRRRFGFYCVTFEEALQRFNELP